VFFVGERPTAKKFAAIVEAFDDLVETRELGEARSAFADKTAE
jgi:hypothetical protein